MDRSSTFRTNMIGGREVSAISIDIDKHIIHETNSSFWDTKGNDVLGATALPSYGAFVLEEQCRLFGDISGKKVLEIGCGSGQSLLYIGKRKAAELWDKTAYLFSVGLIQYTNVLLLITIGFCSKNVILMNLGIR